MDEEAEGTLPPDPSHIYGSPTNSTAGLRKETTLLKAKSKELQSSLNTLKSTPSVAVLTTSLTTLEEEVEVLEAKLATLRAGATKPVDPVERAAAEADYARIERVFVKRRKQFREFWLLLSEAVGGDLEDLWVGELIRLECCD